jgi:hypothetical protein
VGDSISQQHFFSLLSALPGSQCAAEDAEGNVLISERGQRCSPGKYSGAGGGIVGLLGGGAKAFFLRNDALNLSTSEPTYSAGTGAPQSDVWTEDWASVLSSGSYRVLILNRGAHWVEDAVLLRELNATLSTLRSQHPELLLIFRATPAGHLDCSSFSQPLQQPPAPGQKLPYHWGTFAQQNRLIEQLLSERFPGVLFLDIQPPTALRPESHRGAGDCLHYCMPGPPDLWTVALIELLALLEGQALAAGPQLARLFDAALGAEPVSSPLGHVRSSSSGSSSSS